MIPADAGVSEDALSHFFAAEVGDAEEFEFKEPVGELIGES